MRAAAARPLLPAALLALALASAAPGGTECPAGTFVVGAGCRPCPKDTFSSTAGLSSCTLCRKCEGRFKYSKGCSLTSDAECTCKDGYQCGGHGCSRCDRICGMGEERTVSGCQPCHYGTFNDQPNGSCKNWTKCSANQVVKPGTAKKDVVCNHTSDNPTLATILPTTSPGIPLFVTVPGKNIQMDIIRISLAVAGLLCIVFLLPSCIFFSIWQKKKLHAVFKKMHTTPEQSVQEDACSCRFPEEEQGEYQDCGKSTEFRDLLEK
ncbi:tumor necrosis factor receptor superfamily member 9 isoform X1 [Anas acuta]|uniref:tumor necrosis factor receptor superfamily member 9 isoform X1 n=1 Tax=Anas acuta TaxID=28680 RepID=UPI0035C90A2B